jgi:hypothetical protein
MIIVLNVHAPTENKTDDTKDGLYKKLEHAFYQLCEYHIKILFEDFNVKVWNEGLHEVGNDNGVSAVCFAPSKIVIVKEYNVSTLQHS